MAKTAEMAKPAPAAPAPVVTDEAAPPQRARPLEVRSVALTGLFLLAAGFTLYVARQLFVPIVVAALFKVMLEPVVRLLTRARVKPALAAAVVMTLLLGALAFAVLSLREPAMDWLDRLPAALRRVEDTVAAVRGPVDQMKEAAEQVEEIAGIDPEPGTAVTPAQPSLQQMLFNGVWRFAGTAVVMLVLLYFLLASGDLFLLKLVRILPRLDDKKRAVEVARQIESDISRHLLSITIINFALGAVTALGLYLAGMPNPILWGLIGAVLNYIPYIGPLLGAAMVGAAAFVTFDDPGRIWVVVAIFFVVSSLEGNLITPLVLGRSLALNPVAVFLGLFFWGFLWGPVGALIAVPMLIAFKTLCDRIERLAPLGEFLGS